MSNARLFKYIDQLADAMIDDCGAVIARFPLDTFNPVLHEVATALVSRHATIAIELIKSPGTWNNHVAPLFHRAMSDCQITLAYILTADSEQRAKEFVLYGLGQEKLAIAHLEAEPDLSDQTKKALESRKSWLNSQRHEYLTEVNVGSHTGKSTRAMAEESGNKGLYDFNFTPFSAAVHSTWQHIGKFNVKRCQEPLHAGHLTGAIHEFEPHPHDAWVATKNLVEVLSLVDQFSGHLTEQYRSMEAFNAESWDEPQEEPPPTTEV